MRRERNGVLFCLIKEEVILREFEKWGFVSVSKSVWNESVEPSWEVYSLRYLCRVENGGRRRRRRKEGS